MLRLFALLCLLPLSVAAAESQSVRGRAVEARLIAAEDGIRAESGTVSAGLALTLDAGWKTYWRSPGEVGLPPVLDWSGSENIADVELSYPVPERFTAFDIQNFGYGKEVVFPLNVRLADPGAAARLEVTAEILVCADICVPERLDLALALPAGGGGGVDAEAAETLAHWIARIPGDGSGSGLALGDVHLDEEALTLTAASDVPFGDVDLFPEHGPYAAFDAPEIVLSDGGRALWARVPVLAPGEGALDITLADGDRAATLRAVPGPVAPAPPAAGTGLWAILAIAALGGLILNVMPCVLPVLSIKLASALQAADRSAARVRAGFVASVAGVMVFFAGLAGIVIALREAGVAVGWGVQFQNPVFLAVMIVLMVLFAANLFGFFAVRLGPAAMTGMARTEARGGWGGDFATGAFAAVMATPCSAPFLGTAVTYALTHGPAQILAVFLAMGAGLAAPFALVAIRPGLVRRLPRPGRWMMAIRWGLGVLLILAAVWLVTVLAAAGGVGMALAVGAVAAAMLLALAMWRRGWAVGGVGLAAALGAALFVPVSAPPRAEIASGWQVWSEARVAEAVASGETVFVDVTADWCLTCKANKTLVLERAGVADALAAVVALRADWTRADEAIADYLRENGRFGIPFNQVFGPGAPEGIVLPELLTEAAVLDALEQAGG
ncbi:protein-disulfide reductase DsbD family protein [Jannaschia seosinensis]|nr:protein-disulfide reductase DsbD domain-containing protein [Jannaschia seosinensis]